MSSWNSNLWAQLTILNIIMISCLCLLFEVNVHMCTHTLKHTHTHDKKADARAQTHTWTNEHIHLHSKHKYMFVSVCVRILYLSLFLPFFSSVFFSRERNCINIFHLCLESARQSFHNIKKITPAAVVLSLRKTFLWRCLYCDVILFMEKKSCILTRYFMR